MVHDFKKLEIWQLSHKITLDIYKVTQGFPVDEKYGLTSQLRRACSSIPANIAEGCWKHTYTDFLHFLYIARGSLSETMYFLILSKDLDYLQNDVFNNINEDCILLSKKLNSFITSLKK